MGKVLVLYAHPSSPQSKLNRHLAAAARELPDVLVRDLYEMYPNMFINAEDERKALLQTQTVVFQFPIYWFSAPAILKEWQDNVLAKGFAFGPNGNALHGKRFMVAVTTGADESSYEETKPHGAPLSVYLQPFEQTARFCGMTLLEPFVVHGVGDLGAEQIRQSVSEYASRLQRLTQEDIT